jgi:hypothetical protein
MTELSKMEESNELLLISVSQCGKLDKKVSGRHQMCFEGRTDHYWE